MPCEARYSPAWQPVLERPFFIFLGACVPSAVLICCAALLLSPTATGKVEKTMAVLANMSQFSTHAKAAFNPAISQAEKDRLSLERVLAFDVAPNETLTSANGVTPALSAAQPDEADSELESVDQAEPTTEPVVFASRASETSAQEHAAPSVNRAMHGPSRKPAISTAKARAQPTIARAYGTKVWAALAGHKPMAVERGTTTVTFKIDASGALGNTRVSSSSGKASLDQLALETVRSSAPFPAPPDGVASYTIRIDFQ
jgi:TonB family protein